MENRDIQNKMITFASSYNLKTKSYGKIKKLVFKDVLDELSMYHCVDISDDDVIHLVNKYIEEYYDSYRTLITPYNTNALVMEVVDDVMEELHYIAILKSQNNNTEPYDGWLTDDDIIAINQIIHNGYR